MAKKTQMSVDVSDRFCSCGEKIDISKMGTGEAGGGGGDYGVYLKGNSPTKGHAGSIQIFVCMNCGCMFTDMDRQIKIGIAK